MQVILLQDVSNVGRKYEEVEVADGYGTNYLIPNGLAQVANESNRNRYRKQKEKAEKERQEKRKALAEAIEKIDAGQVTITTDKAGDQGQLFAGIYPKDIAAAVNDEFGTDITGADIDRDQPISKVGEYEVDVQVLDTKVSLTVAVEAEEVDSEASNKEPTDDSEADGEGAVESEQEPGEA